jgi:dihydropteroate synthase
MEAAGAALLDLGAESTRPGAASVSLQVELARLLPVLRAVRRAVRVPLSIDTTKAEVARIALAEGADLINDVSAGRFDERMLPLCAAARVPVVLMHMRGTPRTMQRRPRYRDVVAEVIAFLVERVAAARQAGVRPRDIVLDPGFGFGKLPVHNFRLLRDLDRLVALGFPILVGPSRKGFIGQALGGVPPDARAFGTAAVVTLAVAAGAQLVRVHEVAAMRDAVRVVEAMRAA